MQEIQNSDGKGSTLGRVRTRAQLIEQAQSIAAPFNAQRFELDTPCSKTGSCADCLNKNSICASMIRTRICRPAGKIKVVLVGESLGF